MSLNEFEQILQRYYEGNCTPEEKEWVEQWLAGSNLQQKSPWEALSSEERKGFIDNLYRDIQSTIQDHHTDVEEEIRTKRLWWLWGAAAAACVALAVFTYRTVWKTDEPENNTSRQTWATLLIESGKRKKITLSDGTAVWLQGGSKLSYPETFDSTVRLVKMEGEAFFEVTPNKEKPFIVKTGDLEAKVLGTSFNITAVEGMDKKRIALVEGKLAVRAVDDQGLSASDEIILAPNEEAIFSEGDFSLSKSDMQVSLSASDFKSGNLYLKNTTLDEALLRVGMTYGITIVFDTQKARKKKVNTTFSITDSGREAIERLARSAGSGLVWKDNKTVDFNIK